MHRSKIGESLSECRLRLNWISQHNHIESSIQKFRGNDVLSASALDTPLCCTCSLRLKSIDSSTFNAFVQKFETSEHDGKRNLWLPFVW